MIAQVYCFQPYTGGTLIQLETAMCAAVQSFPGACGINVPRSRFLPGIKFACDLIGHFTSVKAVNDLLVIQSNLYSLDKGGNLVPHPDRLFPHIPPTVKLGDYFKKVSVCCTSSNCTGRRLPEALPRHSESFRVGALDHCWRCFFRPWRGFKGGSMIVVT